MLSVLAMQPNRPYARISLIGLPIMIAEIILGRATRQSPASAIRSIDPEDPF